MGTMDEMLSTPLGVIEGFVYLLGAGMFVICVLCTSDAADDVPCVVYGGW